MKRIVLVVGFTLLTAGLLLAGAQTEETTAPVTSTEFPLEEPVTVTYWVSLGLAGKSLASYSELPMYQEFERMTGVDIEFIHPTPGSEDDQLKLLLAANNLPDVIVNKNLSTASRV